MSGSGPLVFAVQKHRARQLHYDFRLECDGVLKSWAVPKSPSLDPNVKHAAIMVEDHPLDYASFEGAIPQGQYGAGTVIVWDNGTYSPTEQGEPFLFNDRPAAEERVRSGAYRGKLSSTLRGHKLKGSCTLVRMKGKEKDWLLIKHRDDYASSSTDILSNDLSVLTGRTNEQIMSSAQPAPALPGPNPREIPGARQSPAPAKIPPMLATLAEGPFSHPDWVFEPKLDGYRLIAHINNRKVTLLSRRGLTVTQQYDSLVPDLALQPASEIILDGEVIAMDDKGKQCFQCLQDYLTSLRGPRHEKTSPFPLLYYVFDIVYLDGFDLRGVPLRSRQALLQQILQTTDRVRLVDHFDKDGEQVYEAAVRSGLEGVIGKHAQSTYESGKRSRQWLKVKAMQSDEFVIGGYTVSESGRSQTFSSLLLGFYDDHAKLRFAGHVGSGFDDDALNNIRKRLDSLRTDSCPFQEEPPLNVPTTWVRPELVAQVKFTEWTREGRLRTPVFLGLRDDKMPSEVRRVEPVATPPTPERPAPDHVENLLQQLSNPKEEFIVEVEGNRIALTNLDKVLWPSVADRQPVTKRDFLTYLAKVSTYILPHLKDRPLTLTRYPDGVTGKHFYQKHWGHPTPDFVQKVNITEEKRTVREYLLCDNLSSLLWLGQIANIEFHTWFSRIVAAPDLNGEKMDTDSLLDLPDFIIFDLDPYIYSGREASGEEPELNRQGFSKVCEAALWLKDVLDELSAKAFVKTSGKTGLHIYVPIVRQLDYKATRYAAETIARFLIQRHPHDITTEWAQEKRAGKVFLDYAQNVSGKTLASIYSPRPTPGATVSAPLRWEELGKVYPTDFSISTMPERLKETGDLWAGLLAAKVDLREVLGRSQ